ncbi:hypothetical protein H8A99_29325 [Bradyrhizobium sp. Arg68]|uniref:hypothetical protein n=1 Tax=Bradyrhizobium ivorense TaxID=2511166 RepID=UPI001E57A76A|nr:hypothetical protein [Bradyrhizobium ivorense]MCC8940448.1 hypothetical protein [Bradyrhizobium ivorense]
MRRALPRRRKSRGDAESCEAVFPRENRGSARLMRRQKPALKRLPQNHRPGRKPFWSPAIVSAVAPRPCGRLRTSAEAVPVGAWAAGCRRGEGTAMRIGLASFRNPFQNVAVGRFGAGRFFAGLLLPLIAVAGITAWLMLPELSDAADEAVSPAPSSIILTAQTPSSEPQPDHAAANKETPPAVAIVPANEPITEGIAPASPAASEPGVEKSPLEGLRVASQSWRRGGLGSKALVTLTLRNRNDFAVKDIEIACAFARRDGSPLTERKRLITDTIATRTRKTYSRMLVGFVNINATKAKCSVVTASRL